MSRRRRCPSAAGPPRLAARRGRRASSARTSRRPSSPRRSRRAPLAERARRRRAPPARASPRPPRPLSTPRSTRARGRRALCSRCPPWIPSCDHQARWVRPRIPRRARRCARLAALRHAAGSVPRIRPSAGGTAFLFIIGSRRLPWREDPSALAERLLEPVHKRNSFPLFDGRGTQRPQRVHDLASREDLVLTAERIQRRVWSRASPAFRPGRSARRSPHSTRYTGRPARVRPGKALARAAPALCRMYPLSRAVQGVRRWRPEEQL